MDISHLLYFKEVVEQGSLSKAAQALFVSQPALSVGISKVESDVGVQLFDRVGKKLVLTRAGEEYYQYVCRAVATIQNGKKKARTIAEGNENLISLGAFTYVSFSTITTPFLGEHPECRFHLLQLDGTDIVEQFRMGRVDCAWACAPIESDAVGCYHLLTQKLYLTVPNTHPLAAKSYIKLTDVRDERFILPDKSTPFRAVVDRIFEEAGFEPRISYEVNAASLLAGMITSGEGISILPDTFSEHKSLSKMNITVPSNANHQIYFLWAKDRELSPASQLFLNYVRNFYKDYPREAKYL